jgi:hypothetical protein
MANTDRPSGKASYFTYNQVNIPITKMDATLERKMGDTTDNGDYNATQDLVWTTQIPCTGKVTGTMEGRFRLSITPLSIMAGLFTSLTQIPIVIGINLTPTVWGHGLCDISNFKTSIPVEDVITWTCDFVSWGSFTPNS